MAKYRKKPVVIEATQFNEVGDHPSVVADPNSPTGYGIHTLEHTTIKHEVTPGDWIITGVQGEVYACKNDIFQATYEPVSEVVTVDVPKGTDYHSAKDLAERYEKVLKTIK